jgi:hypothetical protein
MPYTYKYIPSGTPIQLSPKEDYLLLTQKIMDDSFYNASDWFTIEEETTLGSGVYQETDVRINYAIDSTTGERVGDDFKKIIFPDINHYTSIGLQYRFDNNIWLTVEVDKIKTMAATATVKRCNNTLRWMDDNGAIYSVPCSIGYLIKENRDYSTAGSALTVPAGMIEVVTQYNEFSNKIKPNQRFLFGNSGNWTAYRIEGGGIANFNLLNTNILNSAGIIRFSMVVDYSNPDTDDFVLGIANSTSKNYEITLNTNSLSGEISQGFQLFAEVTLNGNTVNRNLVWSSNDVTKAIVNNMGYVTLLDTGSATITCSLENNASVYATCLFTITNTPSDTYTIQISPLKNYVLEGLTETFLVYLYKNGIQQSDSISFSLASNSVPSSKYTYTVIDSHSFSIENKGMYLTDTLDVTATSGSTSETFSILLKGGW